MGTRADAIDREVESAVRGKKPAAPHRNRPMSPAEKYMLEAEMKGFNIDTRKLERLRRQQSTDGANGR